MSAIARLVAVANINICYELAPKHFICSGWLGRAPTWGEMMEVLREVGMIHLALRIEKYFTENGLSLPHEINIVLQESIRTDG